MSFYAYILRCSDGSYYVGHSEDLEKRMAEHEVGPVPGYTRTRRPVRLVWAQDFSSRLEALECERQIKGWSRAKKEALIKGNCARLHAWAKWHLPLIPFGFAQGRLRQAQDSQSGSSPRQILSPSTSSG